MEPAGYLGEPEAGEHHRLHVQRGRRGRALPRYVPSASSWLKNEKGLAEPACVDHGSSSAKPGLPWACNKDTTILGRSWGRGKTHAVIYIYIPPTIP